MIETVRQKINTLFRRHTPMEREIADLHLTLRNVAEVKAMAEMPGWVLIHDNLVERVAKVKDEIYSLSVQPQKNERDILYKRALAEAYNGLVELTETTVAAEPKLREKLQTLSKIIDSAASSEPTA